jgi:hypothetical protein
MTDLIKKGAGRGNQAAENGSRRVFSVPAEPDKGGFSSPGRRI